MTYTHMSVGIHDVVHCGNDLKWYTAPPPDTPESFITLTACFTILSGMVFRSGEFHICIPVSAHGLAILMHAFKFINSTHRLVYCIGWLGSITMAFLLMRAYASF